METITKTSAPLSSAEQKFMALPEGLKAKLTLGETINKIADINDEFGIYGTKISIIPELITLAVVNEINENDFRVLLQNRLGVSQEIAKGIYERVQTTILAEIKDILQILNSKTVDSTKESAPKESNPTTKTPPKQSAIDSLAQPKSSISAFAQVRKGSLAQPAQEQALQQKPKAPTLQPQPQQSAVPDLVPKQQPQKPDLKSDTNQQTIEKPFMLHEEAPKQPSTESNAGPAFRFELPRSASQPQRQQTPQEKARFGSFFKGINKTAAQNQPNRVESKHDEPKVVHYSAFRTILGDKDNLPK